MLAATPIAKDVVVIVDSSGSMGINEGMAAAKVMPTRASPSQRRAPDSRATPFPLYVMPRSRAPLKSCWTR